MDNKTIANGMLFVDDEEVIGKWEYFDVITSIDQFDYIKPNRNTCEKGFKEIWLLPEGKGYWIFEGWTKGYLLIHYGGNEPVLCYKYNLKKVADATFMFLEVTEDGQEYINVLKKVSDRKYNLFEIGRRDNIDMPFVPDEHILGKWKSVAYVKSIDDFTGAVMMQEDLWLKSVYFYEDGKADRVYDGETWSDLWTRGFLLDKNKSTASAYEFRKIHGIEYLFIQWKMGNYVYGGEDPSYYVFIRECS